MNRAIFAIICAAFLTAVCALPASAVVYVDKSATGAGTGANWANACTTIQAGINVAAAKPGGDEVWVAAGNYNEARNQTDEGLNHPSVDGALVLRNGVHVYGGFIGNETLRQQRTWIANITIIDGSTALAGSAAYHVVEVMGADEFGAARTMVATLDGFTIRGGRANGATHHSQRGGGLYAWYVATDDDVTIANCTFNDNEATAQGGAVYTDHCSDSMKYINCVFYDLVSPASNRCTATAGLLRGGGAMACDTSTVLIKGCEFNNNAVLNGYSGGAIFAWESALTIEECRFNENSATLHGGAVHVAAAPAAPDPAPEFTNCAFWANTATKQGGGVFTFFVDPLFNYCTFFGNTATKGNAVRVGLNCQVTVQNSITWTQSVDNTEDTGSPDWYVYPFPGMAAALGTISTLTTTTTDPSFVSALTGDLRLLSTSNSRDNGTTAPLETIDINGCPRPKDAANDRGAYEYDGVAPQCTAITIVGAPTLAAPVWQYRVTFNDVVDGVDLTDFNVGKTGSGNIAPSLLYVVGVNTGAPILPDSEWFVYVDMGEWEGQVRLELLNDGSIADMRPNVLSGTQQSSYRETDRLDPSLSSITLPDANPTNAASVDFTVTFDDLVSGVAQGNFTLVMTGGQGGASITGVAPVGGSPADTWTVSVSTVANQEGTIALTMANGTGVADDAGNAPLGGIPLTSSAYTVDRLAPTLVSITRGVPAQQNTNEPQVVFNVTFSESVVGVTTGNFSLTRTGGQATASIASVGGGGANWTVTVNTVVNQALGTIRCDMANATGVGDGLNALAGTFPQAGDEIYTVDRWAPVCDSITRADPSPTNAAQVDFDVHFTEPVNGVAVGNFSVMGTGGQGGLVTGVSGADQDWVVTVDTNDDAHGMVRLDLSVTAGITDDFTNPLTQTHTGDQSYVVDRLDPTCTAINRDTPAQPNTNAAQVVFGVMFSENVTGVAVGNFSIAGTLAQTAATVHSVDGSGTNWTVTVNTAVGDGTLTVNLDQNLSGIVDAQGNVMTAPHNGDQSYNVDRTAPQCTSIIPAPGPNPTSATQVVFDVTFDEPVSGVSQSNFSAVGTGGQVGAGIASVGPGGTTANWTVTVNTNPGTGTIRVDLDDVAGIQDAVTNPLVLTHPGDATITIDRRGPTCTSITRTPPGVTPTAAATVSFDVLFDEPVNGVSAANFSVNGSGDQSAATLNAVTPSAPAPVALWRVTVNTVAGMGDVTVDLDDTTGITDAVLPTPNPMAASATRAGDESYAIDRQGPLCVSIARSIPLTERTNAATVTFAVTFDEDANNVTTANFSLVTTGGLVGASILGVNGADTDWTVNVSTGTGDGTLRVDLDRNLNAITDDLGNVMVVSRTGDESYEIDKSTPSLTSIVRGTNPGVEDTNAGQVEFDVEFDEPVTGVTAANFSLGTATTGDQTTATISSVVAETSDPDTVWTVTVNTVLGVGVLALQLDDATGITDEATNALGTGNIPYQSDETYNVDRDAPSVSSIVYDTLDPTSATQQFTVTFDKVVVNFNDADDLVVTTTVSYDAVVGIADLGAGDVYTVTFTGVSGEGTLLWRVDDTSDVQDLIGNAFVSSGVVGTASIDTLGPEVLSITRSVPLEQDTNALEVTFAVTFDENAHGVAAGNFTIVGAGSAITDVSGSGTAWTVTVDTTAEENTLRVDFDTALGGVTDDLGNAATVAYTTGEEYNIDRIDPAVDVIALTTASPTNAATDIVYDVTFREDVEHFGPEDLVFTRTGTVFLSTTPTIVPAVGPATTYTVTIPGVVGDGELYFSVDTASDVVDIVGNPLASSVDSDTVVVDNTPPAVAFDAAVLTPANAFNKVNAGGQITFPITYTDVHPVTITLNAADITVVSSGTVTPAPTMVVDNSTNPATVTLSNLTGDGTVYIEIAADTSYDSAGNHDLGPGGLVHSPTVTVDNTGPVVTIDAPAPALANASATVEYRVHFNDLDWATSTLSAVTLDIGPGVTHVDQAVVNGGTAHPVVQLTHCTGDGTVNITVPAGAARDNVGNPSLAKTASMPVTIDNTPPHCTSVLHTIVGPTAATSVEFAVVFSEPVVNFDGDLSFLESAGVFHTNTLVVPPAGPSATYDVTISGIGVDPGDVGTLQMAVSTAGDVTDRAGNPLASSVWSNILEIDQTALSVLSITADTTGAGWYVEPGLRITRNDTINYVVQFSSDVYNFDPGDLRFTETGTVIHTTTSILPPAGPEDTYNVSVGGIAGDGTMTFGFQTPSDIHDAPGNILSGTMNSPLMHIDNTGPTAASIVPVNPGYWANPGGPTNDTVVEFTVAFNEPVMNFGVGDLVFTETGTVTHTSTSVIPPAGPEAVYTVRVSGITGIGTMNLSVDTLSDIEDRVGNPIQGSVTSIAVIFIEDEENPYCTSITAVTPSPTNDDDVVFAVLFSEKVTNFDGDDLLFTVTGTVAFATAVVTPNTSVVPAATFLVTVQGVSGDGNLSFTLDTTSDVTDLFHNPLQSSVPGEVMVIDNTAPAILFTGPTPDMTVDGPVQYVVTYDDLHFDTTSITLSAADITLNQAGKAAPTVVVSGTGGNSRTVTISDIAQSDLGVGEVTIQITRPGTGADLAGNSAPISGESDAFMVEQGAPLAWWPVLAALLAGMVLVLGLRRKSQTR